MLIIYSALVAIRVRCVRQDASSDQRRKIANQRNIQDLEETQLDLERHRQLLRGIIATIRIDDDEANRDLYRVIRSGVDLSQITAHVRNECRANMEIQQAYDDITFLIEGSMRTSVAHPITFQDPFARTTVKWIIAGWKRGEHGETGHDTKAS